MRRIMKSRHLSDDALVALPYDWINNYENAEHVPVYIYDGITRKERVIIVPTMEELIVQHNVVNALKPMFCKGMYEHSYASLPGRGAHKGKQVIEKWIRTDAKKLQVCSENGYPAFLRHRSPRQTESQTQEDNP